MHFSSLDKSKPKLNYKQAIQQIDEIIINCKSHQKPKIKSKFRYIILILYGFTLIFSKQAKNTEKCTNLIDKLKFRIKSKHNIMNANIMKSIAAKTAIIRRKQKRTKTNYTMPRVNSIQKGPPTSFTTKNR